MDIKNLKSKLKKNWFSILFYAVIITLLLSTTAKSWLLQQAVSVGIFNAKIKTPQQGNNLTTASYFNYSNEQGEAFSTSDLKGKVIFINVWASWCPPCRAEMPELEELYQKFKNDDRIVFLFLNEDEDVKKGIEYLKKSNFAIPFYKANGRIPEEIFTSSLPTTVVINKDGKIVMKHNGVAGYNNSKFIDQLKALF